MKKFPLFAAALATLFLFSCSKDDETPAPEPWIPDYCEFQIHYFVPDVPIQTVVSDSMLVNDALYATRKEIGLLYSYSGLPNPIAVNGSVKPLYFVGYKDMVLKLFKNNIPVYDKKISNIENGGTYHLVIYDPAKEPAVFSRMTKAEDIRPTIRVKFANFLFQNPTTKYSGTVRLQYAYQDDDDWQTIGNALNFGEATDSFSIEVKDTYQYIRFRVVDKNGSQMGTSDGEIALNITPDLGFRYSVLIVGGCLQDGQSANLFQWRSL